MDKQLPWRLKSQRFAKLTKKLSQEYLALLQHRDEREVRQWRIRRLVDFMNSGQFKGAIIEVCEMPDGSIWKVNGQHTCLARLQVDRDHSVVYKIWQVDSERQYRALYNNTDNDKPRTTREQAVMGLGERFQNWGRTVRYKIIEGFRLWTNSTESVQTLSERVQDHHRSLVRKVATFIAELERAKVTYRPLRRAPVTAAAMEILEKHPGTDFLSRVIHRDWLFKRSHDDPIKKLWDLLECSKLRPNRAQRGFKHITRIQTFNRVVDAFNAYREHRTLKRWTRDPDKGRLEAI